MIAISTCVRSALIALVFWLGNWALRISQPLTIVQRTTSLDASWENESLHYTRRNIQSTLSSTYSTSIILSVVCCQTIEYGHSTWSRVRREWKPYIIFSLVLLILANMSIWQAHVYKNYFEYNGNINWIFDESVRFSLSAIPTIFFAHKESAVSAYHPAYKPGLYINSYISWYLWIPNKYLLWYI